MDKEFKQENTWVVENTHFSNLVFLQYETNLVRPLIYSIAAIFSTHTITENLKAVHNTEKKLICGIFTNKYLVTNFVKQIFRLLIGNLYNPEVVLPVK